MKKDNSLRIKPERKKNAPKIHTAAWLMTTGESPKESTQVNYIQNIFPDTKEVTPIAADISKGPKGHHMLLCNGKQYNVN